MTILNRLKALFLPLPSTAQGTPRALEAEAPQNGSDSVLSVSLSESESEFFAGALWCIIPHVLDNKFLEPN